MTRRGKVFVENIYAGIIEQVEDEIIFTYDAKYLTGSNVKPVSLTLPIQDAPYVSKTLFPFFDGLIPEGWLLELATKTWKVDPRDRLGLLLAVCHDCIGNVHIISNEEEKNVSS